jgi:DNA-binding transcriptional MerR regulator
MTKAETVISAFDADHIVRITGLTKRQLTYWDATDFFRPQYSVGRDEALIRVYSFRDAVSLRTLHILRATHRVSLQHLRDVAQRLTEYTDAPFAELRLRVINKEVHFDEPGTGRTRGVMSGQYVLLPIIDVIQDVKRSIADLGKRDASQFGKTEQRRNVSHNARVFAGTRVPVRAVQHFLEDGFSIEQILQEYPSLTKTDIEAVAAGMQTAA